MLTLEIGREYLTADGSAVTPVSKFTTPGGEVYFNCNHERAGFGTVVYAEHGRACFTFGNRCEDVVGDKK